MEVPLGDSLNIDVMCIKSVKKGTDIIAEVNKLYKLVKKVIFIFDTKFPEDGDVVLYFMGDDGEEHYLYEQGESSGFWNHFEIYNSI